MKTTLFSSPTCSSPTKLSGAFEITSRLPSKEDPKAILRQGIWCRPVMSALGKLRQEDYRLRVNLSNLMRKLLSFKRVWGVR